MDKIYARVPHSTKQMNNSRNTFFKLPETSATNSLMFKSIQFEKERLQRIYHNSRSFHKSIINARTTPVHSKHPKKISSTAKEMTPSWSRKTMESRQPEDDISIAIKQFLAEKNKDKKFALASELFLKLISTDKKYGWVLKEIKGTYDAKLAENSKRSPQYNTKTSELSKKTQARDSKLEQCKANSYTPSTKKCRDKVLRQLIESESHSKTEVVRTGKRGVIIPRLDLSRVHNDCEKDKVVYVPVRPRSKNFSTTPSHSFC
eukprot:TRINITY_DN7245_c0_g4_i1.p1 TRINITY_DN7245_c0_g4~~TRINITY_DN7245_c0_g4_i1.p1  ORF type:complete len:261 (+),score=53.56 TRINITY_DN7245_c0_g4_i1:105-887(+)